MTTAFTTPSDSDTIAAAVSAAAQAAAAAMPAELDLRAGDTVADPDAVPLPLAPGAAVTAALGGEVSGDIVLVLSEEIVSALTNSPVGAMDVATALRPALEAAAAALGKVRVAAERVEDVVPALDGLRDKGVFLAVPLLQGSEICATLALQVTLPRPRERRGSLDLLRNVAMEVTVEIGRTRMTVAELLSLHPGEVIELDRAAGAPADLLVNGTLIARGEIVVVDEDFGLRISEIVTDSGEYGAPGA
ncbi:flagellar motor switch protein FliN [Modestobacter muralis]|uniref:Flagellar motor switch protein FliN n=1 Tax=Modestobacter muralis TaxID=1608614 RepID=A0A6P0HAC2_9ACTN|nr:flagellar motor switch protein FliN [Modestobacter muralis]NEK94898.1 flagellar motor switch protein FliN [Modestobacter muralis]NEN51786.1 flagellar motor switch protein FliN [Modestobacter muralis]